MLSKWGRHVAIVSKDIIVFGLTGFGFSQRLSHRLKLEPFPSQEVTLERQAASS